MASLQAALLGFGIIQGISAILSSPLSPVRFDPPFTAQENSVLQATAVAVGGMPLTLGLVGILPALGKLDPLKDGGALPIKLGWTALLGWGVALGFFGIFFSVPLRVPMIVKEKLRFPSGMATAQLISVLHGTSLRDDKTGAAAARGKGRQAPRSGNAPAQVPAEPARGAHPEQTTDARSWLVLFASFTLSATLTVLSYFFPVLYALPVFDPLLFPRHDAARTWGWWFTPSLSYVGQGCLMGLSTTVSMTAGAIVGWGVLSPLATHLGWATGKPLDGEDGAKGWIVWVSLAIMSSESLIGLLTLAVSHGAADLRSFFSGESRSNSRGRYAALPSSNGARAEPTEAAVEKEHEPPERLVPMKWVAAGVALSTVLAVVFIHLAFGYEGIAWWATVLAILFSALLAVLAVRALGETDLNPTSGIGKISQLLFALLQPGNVVANLIAGGIAEAGAMQAGDLMQDLKTGHLVGASPRSQFYGQLLGSTFGIFVATLAYKLYDQAYQIPGPEFQAPTAAMWLSLARLVNTGHLPAQVDKFMIASAAIFAVTGVVRTLARSRKLRQQEQGPDAAAAEQPAWVRYADYLPSGIAFAVGILNTPNFSLARLVGGCIAYYSAKRRDQRQGQGGAPRSALDSALPGFLVVIMASGFVLGEGGASIVNLLMKQGGAEPATCWGCRGGCSGCP